MPTSFKFKAFLRDNPMCVPNASSLLKITTQPFIFGLRPCTEANMNKKVALTEKRDLVFARRCIH